MRQAITFLVVASAMLVFSASSRAEVFITYGVLDGGQRIIDLQPNTADQAVQLFITGLGPNPGDDMADSFTLVTQVGDGGTAFSGTDTGPLLARPDMVTGTIWEAAGLNAAGVGAIQGNTATTPLARIDTVELSTGLSGTDPLNLATQNGLVATLFFDTTGIFTDEMIEFSFTARPNATTTVPTQILNGSTELTLNAPDGFIRISAVPEPGSALILTGLGLVGVCFRRRRA